MLTHLASFLLGLACLYMARVINHAMEGRRARAVLDALVAEAREEDDRPTLEAPAGMWFVHHVDQEPQLEFHYAPFIEVYASADSEERIAEGFLSCWGRSWERAANA